MKKNMGTYDRAIRAFIAITALALYEAKIISDTTGLVIIVISIVLLATSLLGTCPLYLPFGISTMMRQTDYKTLLKGGGKIVDVRTKAEYTTGHLDGSLNIPLDELVTNLNRLPAKDTTLIVCCASGVRSSKAVSLLKSKGYSRVINGGSWTSLQAKI